MCPESVIIARQSVSAKELLSELTAIKTRVAKLENALEEKDRELREVSILRGEYVQHLDTIRNLLKQAILRPQLMDKLRPHGEQSKLEVIEPKASEKKLGTRVSEEIVTKKAEEPSIAGASGELDVVESMNLDKLDLMESQTYRERMILMNRIDIYRLFITVIIISGEIKYPRALTSVEERELKLFIDQLNEFEYMVLDMNANENYIWEKGKTIEKHILQLFTDFFKV
jgi:hypothetical protein